MHQYSDYSGLGKKRKPKVERVGQQGLVVQGYLRMNIY